MSLRPTRTLTPADPFERFLEDVLPWTMPAARYSPVHGPRHWCRVADNGARLCAETPGADPYIALLFAVFHGSWRVSDGFDPDHGERGADLARKLREKGFFKATDDQIALLGEACGRHTDGQTTTDPTIGCCWDADRLDLWRVGIRPDPEKLSTAAAKAERSEHTII